MWPCPRSRASLAAQHRVAALAPPPPLLVVTLLADLRPAPALPPAAAPPPLCVRDPGLLLLGVVPPGPRGLLAPLPAAPLPLLSAPGRGRLEAAPGRGPGLVQPQGGEVGGVDSLAGHLWPLCLAPGGSVGGGGRGRGRGRVRGRGRGGWKGGEVKLWGGGAGRLILLHLGAGRHGHSLQTQRLTCNQRMIFI